MEKLFLILLPILTTVEVFMSCLPLAVTTAHS